jgi:transaldolase
LPEPPSFDIKIFADGADVQSIVELSKESLIAGFTTNPTLMRKAGVVEYEEFARDVLAHVGDRTVSFEVISDEFDDMRAQARRLSSWGSNVYVKIPVTNTHGTSAADLIRQLSSEGVKLNVTAILSLPQVETVARALHETPGAIVSVFAGRIADAGQDPVPLMAAAREVLNPFPTIELLWASPREILNLCQAEAVGCDIITMTPDLLKKIDGLGRDLEDVSLATVQMFYDDAKSAGYLL